MYSDTVTLPIHNKAGYGNEVARSRFGYKEEHFHSRPERRSRDFKPERFGSWIGMPNFKHSEPWAIVKNIKDFGNYENHILSRYGYRIA